MMRGLRIGIIACLWALLFWTSLMIPPLPAMAAPIPADTDMIATTKEGEILFSRDDGATFQPSGLKGEYASLSPDGLTLLLVRESTLYIRVGNTELPAANQLGVGAPPMWSPDGTAFVYASSQGLIVRVRPHQSVARLLADFLFTDFSPSLPVLYDPLTKRIVVLKPAQNGQSTELDSIDSNCLNRQDCLGSLEKVAELPFTVTWASFAPSSDQLVLSDHNGRLFLFNTESKSLAPVFVDSVQRTMPAISPDGKRLAYISDGKLVVANLADKHILSSAENDIINFAWVHRLPNTNQPALQEVKAEILPKKSAPPNLATAKLLISTLDGGILVSADGVRFQQTGLQGFNATISPNGKMLAFGRLDGITIYQEDGTLFSFNAAVPRYGALAWSQNGRYLSVTHKGIFRTRTSLPFDQQKVVYLGDYKPLGAAAIFNPVSQRMLIVENIALDQTLFYTVPQDCPGQTACFEARTEIATVPYNVNWASFAPDGKTLAFSEQGGNLYLLNVELGEVTQLINDEHLKYRPTFNPEGTKLAYLDNAHQLYIYDLKQQTTQRLVGIDVYSAEWVALTTNQEPSQAAKAAPRAVPAIIRQSKSAQPFVPRDDVQFVVSTSEQNILVSIDGISYITTGLTGSEVSVSADRSRLSYVRDGRIWMSTSSGEVAFNLTGTNFPVWSPVESMMVFTAPSGNAEQTRIYRSQLAVNESDVQAIPMLQVTNLGSNPRFQPQSGLLVIPQTIDAQKTIFLLVDPICATAVTNVCEKNLRTLLTVPYVVTGFDLTPDGQYLIFSEEHGNLYVAALADKSVSPLVEDVARKSHPAVSRDGRRLAYVDQDGIVYFMNLETRQIQAFSGLDAASVAWAR